MLHTGRAALVILLVLAASAPARAIPVNVRAGAQVELDHRRTRDGLELAGRLLDDLGTPIPAERLAIELGGRPPESVVTDERGRFALKLDQQLTTLERAHPTELPWTIRFPGSRRFSDVVAQGTIELSRRSSRLTLTLSPRASRGAEHQRSVRLLPPDHPLAIVARLEEPLDGTPLGDAEIRLRIGTGAELVGRTGMNGQVSFLVAPERLAAGAEYLASARFAGDALHVPAMAELSLNILLPSRLTLRVVREGDARRGRYRFSGRLSDQNGPIIGAAVAILGREDTDPAGAQAPPPIQRVVATGPDGIFVAAVDARELDALKLRRLLVDAVYLPSDTHAPTRSRPVLLEVPPPAGIPVAWYLGALAALAVSAALAQAHRSGALALAWDRLRALWRPASSPAPTLSSPPPHPVPYQPARARGDWLSGTVLDGLEGHPLPASLRVRDAHGEQTLQADAQGRFELGPLPQGHYLLELDHPGHLTRRLAFEVPHAGPYDGATWSLVAVKYRLREILGEAMGGLGEELAWGVDTPREALARALGRRPELAPPLDELTALVERAHFSPRAAEAPAVDRARELQRQIAEGS